jgi:hypothetical protein
VLASYENDSVTQDVIAKVIVQESTVPHFSWTDGLLRYKNRIWIGVDADLKKKLITTFHSSAMGGHPGVSVTYRRLKQVFAWKGMKSAVHEYVKSCLTCQEAKPDRTKFPGLLQLLPIPEESWKIISIDFIEMSPQFGSFNCILVVVGKFIKYGHFIPLRHPYTVASVAKVFLDQVYKLHGMPMSIVSDRDKIFASQFWRELFSLAKVQLHLSLMDRLRE